MYISCQGSYTLNLLFFQHLSCIWSVTITRMNFSTEMRIYVCVSSYIREMKIIVKSQRARIPKTVFLLNGAASKLLFGVQESPWLPLTVEISVLHWLFLTTEFTTDGMHHRFTQKKRFAQFSDLNSGTVRFEVFGCLVNQEVVRS